MKFDLIINNFSNRIRNKSLLSNTPIHYKKQEFSMQLIQLAKSLYSGRDKSHGITHVVKVRNNAMDICKKLNINDKTTLIKIETAALFHDLWDHKYVLPNSEQCYKIKRILYKELRGRYFSEHDIKDIEIIINNVSLSREIYLRSQNSDVNLKHLQLMRDIVSDADKLEMLGFPGIDRIIEFQMHKKPNTKTSQLKDIVKQVYNDKISKLLDENYIKTEPGREMAEPLMREMDNYIKIIK